MSLLWFVLLIAFIIYMIFFDRKLKKTESYQAAKSKGEKPPKKLLSKRWWSWGLITFLVVAWFTAISIESDQHDKEYNANSHQTAKKSSTKKSVVKKPKKEKVKATQKASPKKHKARDKSLTQLMHEDDYKKLKSDLRKKLPKKYNNLLIAKTSVVDPGIIEITIKNNAVKKYTSDELKLTVKSVCDDVASIYNSHKPYPKHISVANITVVDEEGNGYARADTDGSFDYDAD